MTTPKPAAKKVGKADSKTAGIGKGTPGPGRGKGTPNKLTTEVKTMILEALDGAGGVDYLISKADSHPAAFLSLVGKVLPLQVTGANGGALVFEKIVREIVKPK